MNRRSFLRPALAVTLLTAGFALAPVPPAWARSAPREAPAATGRWEGFDLRALLWQFVSNVWGKEGPSLDPLGRW